MLKSITDGGLQPKIWVESKKFCLHFFSLHLTEKKLGQAFFHQNTILRVSSYFITSHPRNSNFGIFSPKIYFFAKTVDLTKKCRTVTPIKLIKIAVTLLHFSQKWLFFELSGFFRPNLYAKRRLRHLVLLITPKLLKLQPPNLYQIVALN